MLMIALLSVSCVTTKKSQQRHSTTESIEKREIQATHIESDTSYHEVVQHNESKEHTDVVVISTISEWSQPNSDGKQYRTKTYDVRYESNKSLTNNTTLVDSERNKSTTTDTISISDHKNLRTEVTERHNKQVDIKEPWVLYLIIAALILIVGIIFILKFK